MITQQRLRLVQQLAFVLCAGALVSCSQLRQYFDSCPLTHGFVHSSQGNSHFWRNVSFPAALTPLPGNKTFGAIRPHLVGLYFLLATFDLWYVRHGRAAA